MRLSTKKLWFAAVAFTLINSIHADSDDASSVSNSEDCLPCLEQNVATPNQEKPLPHFEQHLIKSNIENRLCLIEKKLKKCLKTLERTQDISRMVNPPAMPLTRNGWDLQVSADALYWKVQEDALTYAIGFSSDQDLGQSAALVKQKYNWGFRVGLDWTLPHDNWDIAATWTHLTSNSPLSKTTIADLKIPDIENDPIRRFALVLQGINEPTFNGYLNASSKYHNHLDQVSLNTAREFFISKWVVLRPYFGLRADRLHQKLHTYYSENVRAHEDQAGFTPNQSLDVHQTNKWQGIGIESGFSSQLSFCGGFSIYGNIAAAAEYGLQKLQLSQFSNAFLVAEPIPTPDLTTFNTSYHICRPILDLQLGLGWDRNFCNDRFHFGLKLGWENHIYFNQSRFLFFQISSNILPQLTTTSTYSENVHGGDLTYQGWTLHASFDF
ncbi:MAG: hypothetical protein LBC45_03425 [Chlamydiales bacterium]|jgi:hypothetical protein|nr:hypothetical protein [Chlamydiales bacterium]